MPFVPGYDSQGSCHLNRLVPRETYSGPDKSSFSDYSVGPADPPAHSKAETRPTPPPCSRDFRRSASACHVVCWPCPSRASYAAALRVQGVIARIGQALWWSATKLQSVAHKNSDWLCSFGLWLVDCST